MAQGVARNREDTATSGLPTTDEIWRHERSHGSCDSRVSDVSRPQTAVALCLMVGTADVSRSRHRFGAAGSCTSPIPAESRKIGAGFRTPPRRIDSRTGCASEAIRLDDQRVRRHTPRPRVLSRKRALAHLEDLLGRLARDRDGHSIRFSNTSENRSPPRSPETM